MTDKTAGGLAADEARASRQKEECVWMQMRRNDTVAAAEAIRHLYGFPRYLPQPGNPKRKFEATNVVLVEAYWRITMQPSICAMPYSYRRDQAVRFRVWMEAWRLRSRYGTRHALGASEQVRLPGHWRVGPPVDDDGQAQESNGWLDEAVGRLSDHRRLPPGELERTGVMLIRHLDRIAKNERERQFIRLVARNHGSLNACAEAAGLTRNQGRSFLRRCERNLP